MRRYLRGKKSARIGVIVNFAKALGMTTEYLPDDDKDTRLKPYAEIASAIALSAAYDG